MEFTSDTNVVKERQAIQKTVDNGETVALKQLKNLFKEERPIIPRPSVAEVKSRFDTNLKRTRHYLPKTKNKGLAGQMLEMLLGIPLSSECLDCSDGELKLFPLVKAGSGQWKPKESIAITMRGVHTPESIPWDESDLRKKISNVLFIAYFRDGENDDYINFVDAYVLNPSNCDLYDAFKADYETITTYYRVNGVNQTPKNLRTENDTSNTVNGTYIQGRTKGQGGKKKTVGFYFLPLQFVKHVLLDQYMQVNDS